MDAISDPELVVWLCQGSLEALGFLYDRYQRMVYRTALAITGDPEAAADLLQDVFLRLHRFARRIDVERPLEPWLYRMTANLSYTWVKRHNRWTKPLEDIAEWLMNGWKNPPLSQVELSDTWMQVQKALSSLPLSQRGGGCSLLYQRSFIARDFRYPGNPCGYSEVALALWEASVERAPGIAFRGGQYRDSV